MSLGSTRLGASAEADEGKPATTAATDRTTHNECLNMALCPFLDAEYVMSLVCSFLQ
ncbi:MAG: hypothetical protein ACOCWV_02430 [Planctomycetota bacterium]